ncbi:MAG TPA: hypothetical protein VEJ88_08890 [Dissulfurispiraceae bacterium]|nr:hypothetical protein [Dissulfurispiraceae bacterium]
MGKCECGAETDWQEVGSTWTCVTCRGEEIEKSVKDLKNGLEKMEQAELSLYKMKVDTLSLPDLLDNLKKEINKLKTD